MSNINIHTKKRFDNFIEINRFLQTEKIFGRSFKVSGNMVETPVAQKSCTVRLIYPLP